MQQTCAADDSAVLEKLDGINSAQVAKVELPTSASSPLPIDMRNINGAQDIVIPELVAQIKSGKIVLEAISKLPFEWRYDQAFQESGNNLDLGPNGALMKVDGLKRGLAFPALKGESDLDTAGAQAVLWNINSIWWSMGAFKFDFQMLRIGQDGPDQKFSGSLKRLYPKNIDKVDKTEQLFRELVNFDSPAFLRGMSYLTFRLYTGEEDFLWLYSVAINATRELTGPNRTDMILRSGVSLDDLLVWSGNPTGLQPKVTNVSQKLVPFRQMQIIKNAGPDADSCSNVFMTGTATSVAEGANWNFESGKYPKAAAWLPTGSVFALREMLKVELVSTDPFSLYGRQVVYVDKASMLPVYKIVFDRAGRHWKTVIGSFALVNDKEHSFVVPMFQVVVDETRNQATIIEYTRAKVCGAYANELRPQDFDPHKIGPQAPAGATPAVKSSPRAAATATPEVSADGILD